MPELSLILPAFIAGLLTFFAPCTLPLVPGYLGFIGGVPFSALTDPVKAKHVRRKIILNGLFYVLGFSLVFVLLGSLFGLIGVALGPARAWLSRLGGIVVIFFGLYLLHLVRWPVFRFLDVEKRIHPGSFLHPGNLVSSLILGATFAFGWTPCVGPILGSILVLVSSQATVFTGAFLLSVFSLGLAVPFLAVAVGIGSAMKFLQRIEPFLYVTTIVGGILLVGLGILLLTNTFALWVALFYQYGDIINYNRLLDYL